MSNLAQKILSLNAKAPDKLDMVAQAAKAKQDRLGGYLDAASIDAGIAPEHSPTATEIAEAGGDAATDALLGLDQYNRDVSVQRTVPQAVKDSVFNASNAFVQGIGGIANLGVGLVDSDAANTVSEYLQRHSLKTDTWLSPESLANRAAYQARNVATSRFNKEIEDLEVAGGASRLNAKFGRIGRDFIDGFSNLDGSGITDTIANGGGSLFGGGVLGKFGKLAKLGRASMPVAIGALEGGGAYQQTFQEMKDLGYSNEEANKAALTSAAIQAPIGAATGILTSKFEAHPLSVGSIKSAAFNILKEGVEESIQGATGQLATNYGIKTYGDPNYDLGTGVGENIAQSLIGGIGIAGVTQGPGGLYRGAVDGTKSALDKLLTRGDRLIAERQEKGPLSESNFNKRINDVVTAIPEIKARLDDIIAKNDTNDNSDNARDYLNDLFSRAEFNDTDADSQLPVIGNAIRGSSSRFEALDRAAKLITEHSSSDADKLSAGLYILDSIEKDKNFFLGALPDAIQKIDDNDPALKGLRAFEDVLVNIQSHPQIQKALSNAMQFAANQGTEVNDQSIKNAIGVSTYAPDKANPELNEKIAFQARNGQIEISPEELKSLEAATNLLTIAQQKQETATRLGLKTSDWVSQEIQAEDASADYKSAAGHMAGIVSAVRANNNELAADRLRDMMMFAQHMQNKVSALNEHLKNGGGRKDTAVKYEALTGNRKWLPSMTGLWVNPRAANSVRQAQQIALDARAVVTLANNLSETFPELGVSPLDVVSLDESLQGPAQEVANLRNAQRERTKEEFAAREKPEGKSTKSEETSVETAQDQVDNASEDKPSDESSNTKSSSKGGDRAVEGEGYFNEYDQWIIPESIESVLERMTTVYSAKDFVIRLENDRTKQVAAVIDPNGVIREITGQGTADRVNPNAGAHGELSSELDQAGHPGLGQYIQISNYSKSVGISFNGDESPTPKLVRAAKNLVALLKRNGMEVLTNDLTEAAFGGLITNQEQNKAPQTQQQSRRERNKEVTALLESTPNRTVQSIEVYPDADMQVQGDAGLHRFAYRTRDGELITGKYTLDGDLIENLDIGNTNSKQTVGATEIRYLVKSLLSLHPEAKVVHGYRMTGGRTSEQEVWFKIENGKLLLSRTDPREKPAADLTGRKLNSEYVAFSADSGSLGIPRSDMPQLPAEARGALTNFLEARGASSTEELIDPRELKPTQKEFSPEKVQKAKDYNGPQGDRAILVSKDNYVVDGHHQWLAARDQQEEIRIIRLNAPITEILELVKQFPSNTNNEIDDTGTRDDAAEGAAVSEPAPELTAAEDNIKSEPEEKPTLKSAIEVAYPDLVAAPDTKNWFHQAFKLPDEPRSRLVSLGNSIAAVIKAMKDHASYKEFIGQDTNQTLTADIASAYRQYLKFGDAMRLTMNKRLQSVLDKPISKDSELTIGEALTQGNPDGPNPAGFVRGRVLSLVQDGKYNQELQDNAILAGLQWLLTSDEQTRAYDAEDVAKILGIQEREVTDEHIAVFNTGISVTDAKRTLAQKIKNFWGVTENRNAPMGYTKGIPESMAAEILHGMIGAGLIKINPETINGKTYPRVVLALDPDNAAQAKVFLDMQGFPNAIERLASIEPEEAFILGEPSTKVAEFQMRNNLVKNTKQQREIIQRQQNVPFYLNLPMVQFVTDLGDELVMKLFGKQGLNNPNINRNHKQSLEGYNLMISSAYSTLSKLVAKAENFAETSKTTSDKVPVYFNYNISRMGRLHMLGKNNPQGNKFIREMLLPTYATVDMTDKANSDLFMLAVAQHWGVKVHKKFRADSVLEANRLAIEKFPKTLEIISDWLVKNDEGTPLELNDEQVDTIRAEFDNDPTPGALHAAMEYARLQLTPVEDRKAFTTALYIEADGVTDGPINAMMHLLTGNFTTKWLNVMNKGGLYIGNGIKTLNEFVQSGIPGSANDVYQSTVNFLKTELAARREFLKDNNPAVLDQFDSLLLVMSDLLGSDIQFNAETGDLILERGTTKNPVTMTIYGSGNAGIANKITRELSKALYERLSSDDGVPFTQDVSDALNKIIFNVVEESGDELIVLNKKSTTDNRTGKGTNFTLTNSQLDNIQDNILKLFVEPMKNSIDKVVGEVQTGKDYLLQTAQIQSIFLEHTFLEEVNKALDRKAQSDPSWKKSDFLSENELNEIYQKLRHVSPLVDTGTQSFLIASSQKSDVPISRFGSALDDTLQTPAIIDGPQNAGVKGIPTMVIGAGDGQMIQNYLANSNSPVGLPVFDGFNMSIADIENGSQIMNQAVYDGWMANPLRAVYDSYRAFVEEVQAGAISDMSPALRNDLAIALFGRKQAAKATPETIVQAIKDYADLMATDVDLIDARKKVLSKINMNVDHMASGESSYQITDKIEIEGEAEEVIDKLNQMVQQEVDQAKAARILKTSDDDIKAELADYGVIDSATNARVINATQFRQMIENLNIPDRQKAIMRDMYRGLANSDYKIITGSLDEISNYAELNGVVPHARNYAAKGFQIYGYTDAEAKLVFMISPSAETLAHELVHASTMEKIVNYYSNPELLSNEVREAVQRIELLAQQWMLIPDEDIPHSARPEYRQIRSTMNSFLSEGRVASALNEFMAWTLTNNKLADVAENIEVSNPLARIAKKAWLALKDLIFGKLFAPRVGKDIYSNLRFNSAVITTSTQNVVADVNDLVAFQARGFGQNDRVTDIRQKFADRLVKWFTSLETDDLKGQAAKSLRAVRVQSLLAYADDIASSFVSHGFPMSMQEQGAFQNIVAALAIEMELNPNSMNRVQDLYIHVTNQLKVEDFLKDSDHTNPNDRYQAQQKFDSIMGNYAVSKDAKGRTTLLPAFLALAAVNDDFRAVLARMQVPASEKNKTDNLDHILENLGTTVMDELTHRVSGSTKKAGDVREAIDILLSKIADNSENERQFINQFVTPVGNSIDKANDMLIKVMNDFSDKVTDKLETVRDNAQKDLTKKVADVGILLASLVSEDKSQEVSKGIMSQMNRSGAWQSIHDLFNEFIGRTSENASIYDMIKQVRSFIQQVRQQYREELPQLIAKQFSREVTDAEWTAMFHGLGKTDLASLDGAYPKSRVLQLLSDPKSRQNEIQSLSDRVQASAGADWSIIDKKIDELVEYMNSGRVSGNLLRNAYAIAGLFGEKQPKPVGKGVRGSNTVQVLPNSNVIDQIDQLTTLRAIEALDEVTKQHLSLLVQDEAGGVDFVYSYLIGQRRDDIDKVNRSGRAKINHYKGFVPTENKPGISLIVSADTDFDRLTKIGYKRVGDYGGSRSERFAAAKGYYFAPISGRAMYNQGIMQNVRQTAYGIDPASGYSSGVQTAGRITDPNDIAAAQKTKTLNAKASEPLMPVYAEDGSVIAYERSLNPDEQARLEMNTNLSQAIGIWRGRQVEESNANNFNQRLIDNLKARWDEDRLLRKDEYIDLFDPKVLKDPVYKDAADLLTPDARAYIKAVFGENTFPIRRDMLNDAIGYRTPSVGDMWTGGTRWNQEVQKTVERIATSIFGVDAYKRFVTAEKFYQNFVQDAKVTIVVKSVIVPISNMISNVYQLSARGVPLVNTVKGLATKTAEINTFMKRRVQQIDLEAQLRANETDLVKSRKLRNEIQSIKDANRRMSIWPLIAAGEFSSVSDAGISQDELLLSEGKLQSYIESLANKLPTSVKTAGRYAIVSRNTALFKGLQRAVEYGDFLAKSILYDDLTKRQGKSKEYALSRITEEYVNYDRLSGRTRTYLDTMGLTWFWHFKIRSTKIALSTLRNNPLHLLLASAAPQPTSVGWIGSPLTDNIFAVGEKGNLGYSTGPGMGLHAQFLNPWLNLWN